MCLYNFRQFCGFFVIAVLVFARWLSGAQRDIRIRVYRIHSVFMQIIQCLCMCPVSTTHVKLNPTRIRHNLSENFNLFMFEDSLLLMFITDAYFHVY